MKKYAQEYKSEQEYQSENPKSYLQTVTLSNGREILSLVPEMEDGEWAVVHLGTIIKLAKMLPTASVYEIKRELIANIESEEMLEGVLRVIEDELNFHKTINLIQTLKM